MEECVLADVEVDATDVNCPGPIMRARKALSALSHGKVLKVLSRDPGSERDFQIFAKQKGLVILKTELNDKTWSFYLRHK